MPEDNANDKCSTMRKQQSVTVLYSSEDTSDVRQQILEWGRRIADWGRRIVGSGRRIADLGRRIVVENTGVFATEA